MVSPSACAMVSGFGTLAPRAATSRLERAPGGSAGGTRGGPRAQGAVAPGVRQHAEHEKARAARGAPRLEARGAASAPAEAEAREESARETRVDVALSFNPAWARRVRGRSRVATGSSPNADARDPRAVVLVDAGASRAAEVAAENAIAGSARPARGAASPGSLNEKKSCFARRANLGASRGRRGGVGAGSRTRTCVRVRSTRGSRGAVRSKPAVRARRV